MPKETSKKRKSLTAAKKKEICSKKISNSSLKQKDLAKEYDVSKGMVSNILTWTRMPKGVGRSSSFNK